MENSTRERSIGSLWAKRDKNGKTYYTGIVDGKNVICFQNKAKDLDSKRPDLVLYPQRPRQEKNTP